MATALGAGGDQGLSSEKAPSAGELLGCSHGQARDLLCEMKEPRAGEASRLQWASGHS